MADKSKLDQIRKILSSEITYNNKFMRVREEMISVLNTPGQMYYTVEGEFETACVLAIDNEDNVILIEQYKFTVDDITLDIPGGAKDRNESLEQAARREFEEETGYSVGRLNKLCEFYADPGRVDSRKTIFVGTDLKQLRALEPNTETLKVHKIPLAQLREQVLAGEHREPALIISILTYSLKAQALA